MTSAEWDEALARAQIEQEWVNVEFRSRALLVLAAATASAVLAGVLAAFVDPSALHVLFVVLSVATLLSLATTAWWLMKPLIGPWHCPPEPTRLNGASALSVVLVVSVGALVLVNALTGRTPL
jgi:hypothetical protein